jgi:hypothetical protein
MLPSLCTALTVLLATAQLPQEHCVPPLPPPVVQQPVYVDHQPPPPPPLGQNCQAFEVNTTSAGVSVNFRGRGVEVTADHIQLSFETSTLVLEGHVQLHSASVHVSADRISIRLPDGLIEFGTPQPPPPVTPVAPPLPQVTPGVPTPSTPNLSVPIIF